MVSPVDRSYGWQVRWQHREVENNKWQGVAFRRDAGQTRTDAQSLCDYLDGPIQRRIADTHPWVTERRYLNPAMEHASPSPVGLTLKAVMDDYTKTRTRTPETQAGIDWAVKRYFDDWLKMPVAAFTTAMLQERWSLLTRSKDQGGRQLADSTARIAMNHILSALRYAHRRGDIAKDPVIKDDLSFMASPPRDEYTDEEPLKQEEYYKLLAAANQFQPDPGTFPSWWKNPLTPAETLNLQTEIMGETGVRIGEVLAFAVEDVDFGRRCFHVDHHIVKGRRKPGTKAGPKATRTVGFPKSMVPKLEKAIAGRSPRSPLTPSAQGKFFDYGVWHSRFWLPFAAQVEAEGFLRSKVNLIPHLLRHSFATWTAPHVPAMVLMQILGHARIATTQRYYTRVHEAVEVAQAAREAWHVRGGQGHITSTS
jgi:integrase